MRLDESVVVLTAAMLSGTGVVSLQPKFPDRVIDVGIAEGHAVTCSAGLATTGSKPFVAIYSTFLQRALDHIIHDVAVQNLPVRFMLDRAGFVGADGPTHHGMFDLTYLRMIPNMTIMVPQNGAELSCMIEFAYNHEIGPLAIRYPRGNTFELDENKIPPLELGKSQILRNGKNIVFIAVGTMVERALQVADQLEKEGIYASVINARFVKPMDEGLIVNLGKNAKLLVSIEENTIRGGFGSGMLEILSNNKICIPTLLIGAPDRFISQGSQEEQLNLSELNVEHIYGRVLEKLPEVLKRTRKKITIKQKKLAS